MPPAEVHCSPQAASLVDVDPAGPVSDPVPSLLLLSEYYSTDLSKYLTKFQAPVDKYEPVRTRTVRADGRVR